MRVNNNYKKILSDASEILRKSGIERARHESEIILSSAALRYAFLDSENSTKNYAGLPKNREEIAAHPEREISREAAEIFCKFICARSKREPLAYILGEKEFYGRTFIVDKDVLIPRPETEILIDFAKEFYREFKQKNCGEPTILDVGTGSGAIAATLRQEMPRAQIFASDISKRALQIAQKNAFLIDIFPDNQEQPQKKSVKKQMPPNIFSKNYPAEIGGITFFHSDLLKNIREKFDLIIANLPYVDKNWEVSPEIKFEPEIALFAKKNGTELIEKLISTSHKNLTKNGEIIIELDTRQISTVKNIAEINGFEVKKSAPFALVLRQTNSGSKNSAAEN